MNLENLRGRDCMVRAVISATGRRDMTEVLASRRLEQMEEAYRAELDPQNEAKNLELLLKNVDINYYVEARKISSVSELENLAHTDGYLFVGFRAGPDTRPHIFHLGQRRRGGYTSEQQFTPDDELIQQLMEQGNIQVFLLEKS